MVLSNHVISHFHVGYQDVAVLHLNSELSFKGLVNLNGSLDIHKTSFISPVRAEGERYALYELRVTFHRSGSTALSLW